MKRFSVLLIKELRELLTPQTLVPIALVVVVFLGLGKVLSAQTKTQQQPQPILVIDNDVSATSASVVALLRQDNLAVTAEDHGSMPDFTKPISQKAVIVIPSGFGRAMAASKPATLETYTVQDGFSVARLADTSLVSDAVADVNSGMAAGRLAKLVPHVLPQTLLVPIRDDQHMVANGNVAAIDPASVASYLTSQIALVPIVLFIVILFAGQMVATAMANEKENKTLETLLSVPISRTTIVTAKMLAAGIVASITATAYVFGIHSVQANLTASPTLGSATKAAIAQLGLSLSVGSYILLALTLFLGILVALAIALVLGSFADNIKSVQSLIMPLMVLLLVPYLATLIMNVQTLPETFKILLYMIPFTYTFQAMPNLYLHNYSFVVAGCLYELAFFVVFMLFAAKLFSSDRLLTMRLGKFWRR